MSLPRRKLVISCFGLRGGVSPLVQVALEQPQQQAPQRPQKSSRSLLLLLLLLGGRRGGELRQHAREQRRALARRHPRRHSGPAAVAVAAANGYHPCRGPHGRATDAPRNVRCHGVVSRGRPPPRDHEGIEAARRRTGGGGSAAEPPPQGLGFGRE